jgi:hypothetical protein
VRGTRSNPSGITKLRTTAEALKRREFGFALMAIMFAFGALPNSLISAPSNTTSISVGFCSLETHFSQPSFWFFFTRHAYGSMPPACSTRALPKEFLSTLKRAPGLTSQPFNHRRPLELRLAYSNDRIRCFLVFVEELEIARPVPTTHQLLTNYSPTTHQLLIHHPSTGTFTVTKNITNCLIHSRIHTVLAGACG